VVKRPLRSVLIALLVILFGVVPTLAQQAVTPQALGQNPDRYDKQLVSVTGTIVSYRERVSAHGKPYTTFRVKSDSASVSVFAWKHQGLRNGQRVRVIGTFKKVKVAGGYRFRNEIEAQRIEALPSGKEPATLVSSGSDDEEEEW
jgi:hypothetical protein